MPAGFALGTADAHLRAHSQWWDIGLRSLTGDSASGEVLGSLRGAGRRQHLGRAPSRGGGFDLQGLSRCQSSMPRPHRAAPIAPKTAVTWAWARIARSATAASNTSRSLPRIVLSLHRRTPGATQQLNAGQREEDRRSTTRVSNAHGLDPSRYCESKPSNDGLTKRVSFIRATCLYSLIGPRSTLSSM